jgi:hypothetical protein
LGLLASTVFSSAGACDAAPLGPISLPASIAARPSAHKSQTVERIAARKRVPHHSTSHPSAYPTARTKEPAPQRARMTTVTTPLCARRTLERLCCGRAGLPRGAHRATYRVVRCMPWTRHIAVVSKRACMPCGTGLDGCSEGWHPYLRQPRPPDSVQQLGRLRHAGNPSRAAPPPDPTALYTTRRPLPAACRAHPFHTRKGTGLTPPPSAPGLVPTGH